MKNLITGRCLCGYIKYEFNGELGPASYCHCSDCRKESGSAFIVVARLEEKEFKIADGETKSYTKTGGSGNPISRYFCPNCGSTIFTKPSLHPGYIWIRAGTLDNPNLIKPAHQSWTSLKVEWANISDNIKSYERSRN